MKKQAESREQYVLAKTYQHNDRRGKAIKLLEELVLNYPHQALYREELGAAYLMRGWHKKALRELEVSLRLNLLAADLQEQCKEELEQDVCVVLERAYKQAVKYPKIKQGVGDILMRLADEALGREHIEGAETIMSFAAKLVEDSLAVQEMMDKLKYTRDKVDQANKLNAYFKAVASKQKCWNVLQKEPIGIPNYKLQSTVHKIGRNEKCPCNSGKKYKKCCGQ
ncbi:tetratricopeptide repeat protein [Cellulosilyticum sp. I15G10I2]|uniref:tetratricopeptide repeat protein n=1 Tax=Cellulosilyticum sp. I15G10I2 TaxID=1892843 RepID=UPI00085BD855|nr:SEC-C metal-binding domain-containing protein [Cellulosilyticum sp. I15G10I2]